MVIFHTEAEPWTATFLTDLPASGGAVVSEKPCPHYVMHHLHSALYPCLIYAWRDIVIHLLSRCAVLRRTAVLVVFDFSPLVLICLPVSAPQPTSLPFPSHVP